MTAAPDPSKLEELLGKVVADVGSTMTSILVVIGDALGAQVGEARLAKLIVGEGGFSRCRRAKESPFNIVLEARP